MYNLIKDILNGFEQEIEVNSNLPLSLLYKKKLWIFHSLNKINNI